MIKIKIFNIIFFISLSLLIFQCSENYDQKISDGIISYKNGNQQSIKEIEKFILDKLAIVEYNIHFTRVHENGLFRKKNDELNILYPKNWTIPIDHENRNYYFHFDNEICAITDGTMISYLEDNGGFNEYIVELKKKESFSSLLVFGNSILYSKNFQLFGYDCTTHDSELIVADKFYPYYKKTYNTKLIRNEKLVGLITGIAGAYKISVIDPIKGSVAVKNIKGSSSKVYLSQKYLYYLSGTTGNWKVTRFTLSNKNKKYLATLKNITDFEFSHSGFIYENKEGLNIALYNKKEISIPFNYMLWGNCRSHVVLKFNDRMFLVNHEKLYNEIKHLKTKLPELFK